ncbi:MAG: hypothetical protein FD143_3582 [Ignavibacteria bacterium]|nr:MAG: hypothetical protein FD143_3582 [Ignavibacteria bacterium]
MSSSYPNAKIANSVREGGFQKSSYLTGEFLITAMLLFQYIFNQCTTTFYYGITINGKDLSYIKRVFHDMEIVILF